MAQTKMITPQSSLLKYDSPILISKTTDINLDELLKVIHWKILKGPSVTCFLSDSLEIPNSGPYYFITTKLLLQLFLMQSLSIEIIVI